MTRLGSIVCPLYADGFHLAEALEGRGGLRWIDAAAVSIAKGDFLIDNGSGQATNVVTAFIHVTPLGVAAAPANNSAGTAGDIQVSYIPWEAGYYFWVPNESATVAAQADIGTTLDLASNHGVDVTDNAVVGLGFKVVDVDISTEAVAVETGGYVKGKFVVKGVET